MNNNIINIAEEIQKKIADIEKVRLAIRRRGIEKSEAISKYEKVLAVKIIELKNGKSFELEGEIISGNNLQANLVEKVSRGLCWQEKLEMEKTDALYRSVITNLTALIAELNGLQSLFRHLDEK